MGASPTSLVVNSAALISSVCSSIPPLGECSIRLPGNGRLSVLRYGAAQFRWINRSRLSTNPPRRGPPDRFLILLTAIVRLSVTLASRRRLPGHGGIEPDRQRPTASECFVMGGPVSGLEGGGVRLLMQHIYHAGFTRLIPHRICATAPLPGADGYPWWCRDGTDRDRGIMTGISSLVRKRIC